MKVPSTISTIAARTALASRICSLSERYGAIATVTEPSIWDKRGLDIDIAVGPYRCSMDFVPSMWPGGYLAHWYTADHATEYPAEFGADIRGDVNPYHHTKATTCEDTLDGFMASLEGGLRCLQENGLR